MALECGCIAQNCAYCDDGLRVILHQKANRVLHPLNGYVEASTAQPAHPADRFAREILAIVERGTMRSRRLMRNPLGRQFSTPTLVEHLLKCKVTNTSAVVWIVVGQSSCW